MMRNGVVFSGVMLGIVRPQPGSAPQESFDRFDALESMVPKASTARAPSFVAGRIWELTTRQIRRADELGERWQVRRRTVLELLVRLGVYTRQFDRPAGDEHMCHLRDR